MAKGNRGGKRSATKAVQTAINNAKNYIDTQLNRSGSNTTAKGLSLKVGDEVNGREIDSSIFYKNMPQSQWFLRDYDATVKRTSDKAVLLEFQTKYGNASSWFPKSVIGKPQKASKGLLYNEGLKQYAISLGIKGIKVNGNMKTDTIKKKIQDSGHKIPNYADFGL